MIVEISKFISKVIITFILTNIQDVVILINFFLESAETDSLLKNQHVVLGQYLGFSTLLTLSLIGYTISYILPVKLFGFLGFLIIFFGLNGLNKLIKDLLKKRKEKRNKVQQHSENEQVMFIQFESNSIKSNEKQTCTSNIKQIIKVSLVTIANGNDNIAIYVPIFVQSKSWEIVAYAIGFLLMVGVLCLVCYCFIHFPPIFKFAQKYAHFISPFIFIALGIYILIDSKCFPWLIKVIKTGQWTIS
ncbi:unnamed protein product [Rotaria sordida]|uniref:Cadmium resistance transporter n=1 Tax=Rotaria sordida TaxID=392033 RepID=A0A814S096_9BILA|nr:unnamed protein product [Rotaria sordida]CAF3941369.1 unnamed protein product [Rotaria sordida]